MNPKEIISNIEKKYMEKELPDINIGDTVVVHVKIQEGKKTRIQKYEGIVIAKGGKGVGRTITVRKISNGVGVERIFSLFSQAIDKISIKKRGKVKRARLYYLRKLKGKAATKVKEKK